LNPHLGAKSTPRLQPTDTASAIASFPFVERFGGEMQRKAAQSKTPKPEHGNC
jgi:hypothetical protein